MNKRLLDAAIAVRDEDKTEIGGGGIIRLWVHPDTWKEFVAAIEGAAEPEHGPVVPSPAIDPEVVAEYNRAKERFDRKGRMPR
jgi:hypothetical protein